MLGLLLLGSALAATPLAQPADARSAPSFNPRALELFEVDSDLMRWAVLRFDSNRDGRLSIVEAQPAALDFKAIADGDTDGRVTLYEFDRAREFIIARYPATLRGGSSN